MPAIYVDTENDRRKMNVTNKQLRRTHWQHNSIRVHGQGLIRIKLRAKDTKSDRGKRKKDY